MQKRSSRPFSERYPEKKLTYYLGIDISIISDGKLCTISAVAVDRNHKFYLSLRFNSLIKNNPALFLKPFR
jgi:hypothetical protein